MKLTNGDTRLRAKIIASKLRELESRGPGRNQVEGDIVTIIASKTGLPRMEVRRLLRHSPEGSRALDSRDRSFNVSGLTLKESVRAGLLLVLFWAVVIASGLMLTEWFRGMGTVHGLLTIFALGLWAAFIVGIWRAVNWLQGL